MSPQENEQINQMVKITGMTKQDYITSRLYNKEIIIEANPRVYKGLRVVMEEILSKLNELNRKPDEEMIELIKVVSLAMNNLKGGE